MFLHVYGTCAQVYTVLSAGGTRWMWVKERGMLMYAALFIGLIHVHALCPFPCDISEAEEKSNKTM